MDPIKPSSQTFMQAVPPKSEALLAVADWLDKAQKFAGKPFGYNNPPAQILMNVLGVPSIQKTVERAAYGEPMTTGQGMTTQLRPEVMDTLLSLAPYASMAGKAMKAAPKKNFSLRINNDMGMGRIEAVDKNGKVVGILDAELGVKGTPENPALTHFAEVQPEWQRKGVGTAMYDKFDEMAGYTMPATLDLSTPAFNLWSKRHPERMTQWMDQQVKDSMPSNFELRDFNDRKNLIDMWKRNMPEETRPHYKEIMQRTLDNMEFLHKESSQYDAPLSELFFGGK